MTLLLEKPTEQKTIINTGVTDDQQKIKDFIALANKHKNSKDYARMEETFQIALKKVIMQDEIYNAIAETYISLKDYKYAINAYKECLRIKKARYDYEKDWRGIYEYNCIIADLYKKINDYNSAVEFYENAKNILKDKQLMKQLFFSREVYLKIADCYKKSQNIALFKEYKNKAFKCNLKANLLKLFG